jgi:hypothetical protein
VFPGQKLFQLAGRSHKGTATGLPFNEFSLLQVRLSPKGTATRLTPQGGGGTEARLPHKGTATRLATGVFKLVDEIFTGIFPHVEIIAQENILLNRFHAASSKTPLSPLTL